MNLKRCLTFGAVALAMAFGFSSCTDDGVSVAPKVIFSSDPAGRTEVEAFNGAENVYVTIIVDESTKLNEEGTVVEVVNGQTNKTLKVKFEKSKDNAHESRALITPGIFATAGNLLKPDAKLKVSAKDNDGNGTVAELKFGVASQECFLENAAGTNGAGIFENGGWKETTVSGGDYDMANTSSEQAWLYKEKGIGDSFNSEKSTVSGKGEHKPGLGTEFVKVNELVYTYAAAEAEFKAGEKVKGGKTEGIWIAQKGSDYYVIEWGKVTGEKPHDKISFNLYFLPPVNQTK